MQNGRRSRRSSRPIASRLLLSRPGCYRYGTGLLLESDRRRARVAADPFPRNHIVRATEVAGDTLRIEGDGPNGAFSVNAQQVVNATWERRAALDCKMGIPPPQGLLYRLKYRVMVRAPGDAARSIGDDGGGTSTGRMWRYVRKATPIFPGHPTGLRGWTSDIEPPRLWDEPCRGNPPADTAREVGQCALRYIDEWYPGIADTAASWVSMPARSWQSATQMWMMQRVACTTAPALASHL